MSYGKPQFPLTIVHRQVRSARRDLEEIIDSREDTPKPTWLHDTEIVAALLARSEGLLSSNARKLTAREWSPGTLGVARPVLAICPDGEGSMLFQSIKDAAYQTGSDQWSIWKCLEGKAHTHNGFRWVDAPPDDDSVQSDLFPPAA